MTTTTTVVIATNLIAILALAATYQSRHHRKDLLTAFIGVNIGVLAVALVLSSTTASLGLGLGLFAVLSIIRLRSDELAQHEIAYYFSALTLGLIAGLTPSITLGVVLTALVLASMYLADHPAVLSRRRRQVVRLDGTFAEEHALRAELERRLPGTVASTTVLRLDLVDDTTTVDVRYTLPQREPATRRRAERSQDVRARDIQTQDAAVPATASDQVVAW